MHTSNPRMHTHARLLSRAPFVTLPLLNLGVMLISVVFSASNMGGGMDNGTVASEQTGFTNYTRHTAHTFRDRAATGNSGGGMGMALNQSPRMDPVLPDVLTHGQKVWQYCRSFLLSSKLTPLLIC